MRIFKGDFMEFNIDKNTFLNCIQKVQSVIERKNAVPILSNVRLIADSGKLEINATDLDVALKDFADIQIVDPGSITVSAKKLYEVLKELPEDRVSFRVEENNWIAISCGMARFKLVGMSDEDFPVLPMFDESRFVKMSSDVLDHLTRKSVYAVSTDENRHVLNGVLFTISGVKAKMIATDGHRLAFVEMMTGQEIMDIEVIVPQKGIKEIQRMISSGAEEILFGVTENHIAFKVGNETILTRLVDGKFPDYSKVIPQNTQYEIKINKESLNNSLRRVSLFSDLKVRGVKLEFRENTLHVTASTPEYGEAKDQIPVDYNGETISTGFNVNYLLDLLRTIDTEDVILKVSDPSGPIVFEPSEKQNYHYLAIVMPMII
jgi:DNA polymerase III subunit beta